VARASLWGVLGGLALCLAVSLGVVLARRLRGRRARRRAQGGLAAQRDAERLLLAEGYRILERQPQRDWCLRAAGQEQRFRLRPDFLVQRGARRYVAEVKSGDLAPRLAHGATRRQLLEYLLAFPVAGVLLVEPAARRVEAVEFPALGRGRGGGGLRLALSFGLGLALGGLGLLWLWRSGLLG